MNRSLDPRTAQEISRRLAEFLAVAPDRVRTRREPAGRGGAGDRPDLLLSAGGYRFPVAWKASGQAAAVTMAIQCIRRFADESDGESIPLVAAPYIGEVGRRLCQEAGVGWLDLSGNARLVGPGLRVNIEGKPNLFKRSGRPRSVFAPKSARIARWLLMNRDHAFTQRELAKACGLDEGFTSRIVRQLEEQQLLSRNADGAVKAARFDTLLDAWREVYDFSRHHIVRGHIAARASDETLRRMSEQLNRCNVAYAATGLAGAWLWTAFAGFRLVVLYVAELPGEQACRDMGFHETERGENVWMVRPNDAGVFQGATVRDGISCAHPVQVYLDLKNHPERAAEAAQALRKNLLQPDHA